MSSIRKGLLAAAVVVSVSMVGPSRIDAQQPVARQQFQPQPVAQQVQGPPVQPGAQQPGAPPAGAPFVLNAQQQAALNRVLADWEREGAKVNTMKVDFTRYEYDTVFGKKTKSEGVLQYAKPDKGLYRIDKVFEIDQNTGLEREIEREKEHWVCNGESIFEFNAAKRQLIQRPIPANMRGQAIVDGPLPFLFGMTANKLKQRYFMRITTTAEENAKGEVWIEAYPRFQRDAANFARAEIVLVARDLSWVRALKIVLPNRTQHTVHTFDKPAINNPWEALKKDFANPAPPFGWQHVVERPAAGPPPVPAAALQRHGPAAQGAPLR